MQGQDGDVRAHSSPLAWQLQNWGSPAEPYLGHECDLEPVSSLKLESLHLPHEGLFPELDLGQAGVPRRVIVEGEGQDQGLCL